MHAALVLHGDPPDRADLDALRACDLVVAADGGLLALRAAGIAPHHLVGDLDSVTEDDVAWARSRGCKVHKHPERKDDSDGALALAVALLQHPVHVLIVGGHGGRTAHFLANLRLLHRTARAGVDAVMRGRGETLRFLAQGRHPLVPPDNTPAQRHVLLAPPRPARDDSGSAAGAASVPGSRFSLLAWDAPATVTLAGTSYDADRLRLAPLADRGLSNSVARDDASVQVHAGECLLVWESGP